jgi:dTDP-4-amino-4,6-dideoxygalactose transaminase
MTQRQIPFTCVDLSGRELDYVREAIESRQLAGDGEFTARCERWLEMSVGSPRALLTHSCTAALEMAAMLADVGQGDEVIMPSFTFVSTANAFVLRGAVPVFVDIDARTLNVDPRLVAAAVTPRTRAIVPMHYGGNACDMDAILAIASGAGLSVIEDAAQALLSTYRGHPLGSFGATAALSFHQTKNVSAGEGGALLVNDPDLIGRAEMIREKGTDRSRFRRGEVDKYRWVTLGSSYAPGELIAAFLLAQLERAEELTARRKTIWACYHLALEALEMDGLLARPASPVRDEGNAHIYYVLLRSPQERAHVIDFLRARGITAVFHYVPLHDSPAGRQFGRAAGALPVTEDLSARLLRLPLWPQMSGDDVDFVVEAVHAALGVSRAALPDRR